MSNATNCNINIVLKHVNRIVSRSRSSHCPLEKSSSTDSNYSNYSNYSNLSDYCHSQLNDIQESLPTKSMQINGSKHSLKSEKTYGHKPINSVRKNKNTNTNQNMLSKHQSKDFPRRSSAIDYAPDTQESRRIGEGSYGIVYENLTDKNKVDKISKKILVCPCVTSHNHIQKNCLFYNEASVKEAFFLVSEMSPFIVSATADVSENYMTITMPYETCTIFSWVKASSFTERINAIFEIVLQCTYALNDIHVKNIVHGDLKSENVCINPANRRVKLIDFGSCQFVDHLNKHTLSSLHCRAPELLEPPIKIGKANDIFALGLLIIFILTGKNIRYTTNDVRDWKSQNYSSMPFTIAINSVDKQILFILDALNEMLCLNPENRITSAQLLANLMTNSPDTSERMRTISTAHLNARVSTKVKHWQHSQSKSASDYCVEVLQHIGVVCEQLRVNHCFLNAARLYLFLSSEISKQSNEYFKVNDFTQYACVVISSCLLKFNGVCLNECVVIKNKHDNQSSNDSYVLKQLVEEIDKVIKHTKFDTLLHFPNEFISFNMDLDLVIFVLINSKTFLFSNRCVNSAYDCVMNYHKSVGKLSSNTETMQRDNSFVDKLNTKLFLNTQSQLQRNYTV